MFREKVFLYTGNQVGQSLAAAKKIMAAGNDGFTQEQKFLEAHPDLMSCACQVLNTEEEKPIGDLHARTRTRIRTRTRTRTPHAHAHAQAHQHGFLGHS